MHQIRKSIEIKAPVERVFEFLTTPNNFLSIWPSMVEITNAVRRADGTNSFDWVYKMAGLRFKGHAEPKKIETNKYVEMRNESGIPSTFRWFYESRGAGATYLTVEVDYEAPAPVIGKLAEAIVGKINERELETLLANAKSILEQPIRTQANQQPHA